MDEQLDDLQAEVERLAQAAHERLLTLLAQGVATERAVALAQAWFAERYVALLARAFETAPVGADTWNVRQVERMPVGDLQLSTRLWAHARQTAAEVAMLIREHTAGTQQARELALRLYDGYRPADGLQRPLEGRARAKLPNALRRLTQQPADRAALQRVYEQGMRWAASLKTAPLRAAYAQAFERWRQTKGQSVLDRWLEIAHREKTRQMANRIAQTELARAQQHALAAEFMADPSIEVVTVRMSASHPKRDICDLHARADLFGLGPGTYPKARAPRPPFHPYCRCRLQSRPDLSAAGAREQPGAVRQFLRAMPPAEAARVLGSRARLAAVLAGKDVLAVVNAGVPDGYAVKRLGEGAAESDPVSDAYEIAKSGGDGAKLLKQLPKLGRNQLLKSVESLEQRATEHRAKIRDPSAIVPDWPLRAPEYRDGLLAKWGVEVHNFRLQVEIIKGYMDEHGI